MWSGCWQCSRLFRQFCCYLRLTAASPATLPWFTSKLHLNSLWLRLHIQEQTQRWTLEATENISLGRFDHFQRWTSKKVFHCCHVSLSVVCIRVWVLLLWKLMGHIRSTYHSDMYFPYETTFFGVTVTGEAVGVQWHWHCIWDIKQDPKLLTVRGY